MALGKDDIVSMFARVKPRELREVPLSDGRSVFIRKLTLGDRGTRYEQAKQGRTHFNTVGYFLVASLCDPQGNLLFSDGQADEMDELPSDFVEALFAAIASFNGFAKEDHDFFERGSNRTQNLPSNSTSANGSPVLTAS